MPLLFPNTLKMASFSFPGATYMAFSKSKNPTLMTHLSAGSPYWVQSMEPSSLPYMSSSIECCRAAEQQSVFASCQFWLEKESTQKHHVWTLGTLTSQVQGQFKWWSSQTDHGTHPEFHVASQLGHALHEGLPGESLGGDGLGLVVAVRPPGGQHRPPVWIRACQGRLQVDVVPEVSCEETEVHLKECIWANG